MSFFQDVVALEDAIELALTIKTVIREGM